jgi:hypothetical protein
LSSSTASTWRRLTEGGAADSVPATITKVAAWLRDLLPATQAALDDQAAGGAEGLSSVHPTAH